jgi:hypothetical protein
MIAKFINKSLELCFHTAKKNLKNALFYAQFTPE